MVGFYFTSFWYCIRIKFKSMLFSVVLQINIYLLLRIFICKNYTIFLENIIKNKIQSLALASVAQLVILYTERWRIWLLVRAHTQVLGLNPCKGMYRNRQCFTLPLSKNHFFKIHSLSRSDTFNKRSENTKELYLFIPSLIV